MLWVELCLHPLTPPEKIQILTLVPQNVTLFGNSITADETSWDLTEVAWAPNPIWSVSLQDGHGWHTQEERHMTMKAETSDAAKSQGMLKTIADHQDSPAGFRVSMALIADFQPPELPDDKFLLSHPALLRNARKLIQWSKYLLSHCYLEFFPFPEVDPNLTNIERMVRFYQRQPFLLSLQILGY